MADRREIESNSDNDSRRIDPEGQVDIRSDGVRIGEGRVPVHIDNRTSVDIAIKGRNVSGRSWKLRPQTRASSLINTKKNNQSKSWKRRMEEKRLRKESIGLQKELQEEKQQAALLKKERRLENERRRAENEYKNIQKSAQTLNYDTANLKLKTMSKKKLRQIKKSRMNPKTGVVEFVSPFAK